MEQTRRYRIRSLVIPLLIHWGISNIVSMGVMMYIMGGMWSSIANGTMEIAYATTKIVNELMGYMTEITTLSAVIAVPVFYYIFHKDRKKDILYNVKDRQKAELWRYVGIIVLAITACVGLNNLVTLSNLATVSDSYKTTSESFYSSGYLLQLVGIGIIIPIFEELLFRGVFYNRLLGMTTKRRAMIGSAIVFGVYHGNLVQALYGGIMGYLLVYVYEKYGSLKAPILGHITLNLVSILMTKYGVFTWIFKEPLRVGIITVACASISATMFVLIQGIENNNLRENEYKNESLTS